MGRRAVGEGDPHERGDDRDPPRQPPLEQPPQEQGGEGVQGGEDEQMGPRVRPQHTELRPVPQAFERP